MVLVQPYLFSILQRQYVSQFRVIVFNLNILKKQIINDVGKHYIGKCDCGVIEIVMIDILTHDSCSTLVHLDKQRVEHGRCGSGNVYHLGLVAFDVMFPLKSINLCYL